MLIIGCDFHTRYQQIAMMDDATGELLNRARQNLKDSPRVWHSWCTAHKCCVAPLAKPQGPEPTISREWVSVRLSWQR